jgi:hypothetical protein
MCRLWAKTPSKGTVAIEGDPLVGLPQDNIWKLSLKCSSMGPTESPVCDLRKLWYDVEKKIVCPGIVSG